ncbi:MAG: hypothetical protein HY776_04755 [Actinobacteria bacterium]|nr:hypothetical protein [Actinomycetota bacterium]
MVLDINNEDLGIRSFQLQKSRAAERAMEKIRQKLSDIWNKIESKDIEILQWTLGEVWALIGRTEWEQIKFSSINFAAVLKIIQIGKEIINHERRGYDGLEEIKTLLQGLS